MAKRPEPTPKKQPKRHRSKVKKPRPPQSWSGYILDPGQKAALEKKFDKSWHSTFTTFSFFDSFKGPKK